MKKNKKYIFYILIFICIVTAVVVYTKAKYKANNYNAYVQNSEYFYFESDILTEKGNTISFADWNGQGEYDIKFNLYNYQDLLRKNNINTEYEIETTVSTNNATTTATSTTYINNENNTKGTLVGKNSSTDNVVIKLNNLKETDSPIEVKVTATSTYPYSKTISAVFEINKSTEKDYEVNVKDLGDYANLLIKTNSFNNKLKITFNSDILKLTAFNLKRDLTSDELAGKYVILDVTENSEYQLEFIKMNTENTINIDDFKLEVVNN